MENENETKTEKKPDKNELQELFDEAANVKRDFDNCTAYKNSKGILRDAQRAVDFYEGRQWDDFSGKLKIEKPVLNFIQNVTDGKAASILQKTYKPIFVIDEDQAKSDNVTKFSEWQMKEMNQEDLNMEMVYDGLNKGTYISYFYWDEDAVGQAGITDGALNAVTVDLQDFGVANPSERDVQKQEYIIIRSRESVKAIKKQCTFLTEEEKELYITPKGYNSIYKGDIEQNGEETTDVYLKFFRQNGEVYFEKTTDNIMFQKPTSLNPNTNKEIIKRMKKEREKQANENSPTSPNDEVFDQDPVNREMITRNDTEYTEEEQMQRKFMARWYPVVLDSFIKRNNCIFGVSFTAQLIPMQKPVNQLVTTQLISAAKQTMPTIVVKEGALGSSSIDMSKAGGVLVDRSAPGVDGIKVLNTGTMPTTHYELAQSLITLTKDVWRASDVLDDGRNIPSGMSGYAINQLLQVQDKPIAQWQQVLARTIGKEGRILEMFYKLYYRNTQFSATLSDAELLRANPNGDLNTMSHSAPALFNGEDYLNTPFNVTIEVCESAKYSEVMLTSTLETLFLNGTIEKISPEYLMIWSELVPDYVFPKKGEFRTLLQQKMNGIITQLQTQNQQLQAMLQQSAAQQTAMKQEFTNKINLYNDQIKQAQSQASMVSNYANRQLKDSQKATTTSTSNEKNVS